LRRILPKFLAFAAVISVFILSGQDLFAQKLSGQWIGSFTSNEESPSSSIEYVLEFDVDGSTITGYSYTYFPIAGKRYFVICKLKGNYDAGSKSLVINEVEKIKSNTPPDFHNCLQTHKLTYFKQGNREILEGKWSSSEKGNDCGTGASIFERKLLEKIKPTETVKKQAPTSVPKKTTPIVNAPASKPLVNQKTIQKKQLPKSPIEEKTVPPVTESKTDEKLISVEEPKKMKEEFAPPKEKVSNRTYQILKVIDLESDKVKIDIYDNGQIDGDTVSIYMNDKLIVSKRMLTAKPITIQLNTEENTDVYDIVMYAENLGTIPPNTALMIVQTPKNRYEINITSTQQTSGAVRFRVKH
jgi:hypothetical protein